MLNIKTTNLSIEHWFDEYTQDELDECQAMIDTTSSNLGITIKLDVTSETEYVIIINSDEKEVSVKLFAEAEKILFSNISPDIEELLSL